MFEMLIRVFFLGEASQGPVAFLDSFAFVFGISVISTLTKMPFSIVERLSRSVTLY